MKWAWSVPAAAGRPARARAGSVVGEVEAGSRDHQGPKAIMRSGPSFWGI